MLQNKLKAALIFAALTIPSVSPTSLGWAAAYASETQATQDAAEIAAALGSARGLQLDERLDLLSARYLGRAYQGGPLGEGPGARYDADPLFRFDAFDCTTYIETVMALAYAHDADSFASLINRIRYAQGQVSYPTRNHFTDLDWNPYLISEGMLEDITESIGGQETLIARALIDKPAWYAKMQASSLQGITLSGPDLEARVTELRAEGARFTPVEATVPYVPLTAIHRESGVNTELLDRIPAGTIVNIVRPNWDLVAVSGTHQNISHQGLLVRKADGGLYLRHASSSTGYVADVPLADYLRAYLQSPTIKGIQLLKIRE